MYDLIVVGGGFWGVAQALFAEEHGLRVLLIDTPRDGRASIVAAGMFSTRWFKGSWRTRARQALEDARRLGVSLKETGVVQQPYNSDDMKIQTEDFYTFMPQQFLSLRPADRHERVVRVSAMGVETDGGDRFWANNVVVCAGIYTDELLDASGFDPVGVKSLWGSAVLAQSAGFKTPLQVYTNPYAHYTMREWTPGFIRIGETLEKRPGQREAYINKMLTRLVDHLPVGALEKRSTTVSGARPTLEGGMSLLQVPGGPYVATGGGRSGAVMSFWAARELYTLMSREESIPAKTNQGA